MMRTHFSGYLLTAFSLAATAGCTQKSAAVADTAATAVAPAIANAVDTSMVVALERGPCRGRCPVYRVELYGDGNVRFEGKQYVARMGAQRGTTTPAAIQELLRGINASEFTTIDTSFVMGSAACGQYMPDLPMSTLSAKIGTQIKRVQLDPGCKNAPRSLRAFEAQVDSIAQTAKWIAGAGDSAK